MGLFARGRKWHLPVLKKWLKFSGNSNAPTRSRHLAASPAAAGFSAGANGRTVVTCLKTVRRDWSHLQWWRAIKDDGLIEKGSEHEEKLRECGFELEDAGGQDKAVTISAIEEHLMLWDEDGNPLSAEEVAAQVAEA